MESATLSLSQATTISFSETVNGEKALKRKFEEAMQTLDAAVSTSAIEIPQSTKRPKLGKSLYSTLAKYGIRKDTKPSSSTVSRADSIAKNAPHLVAILSRSTSRTRKPVPFTPEHPPSSSVQSAATPGSDYRPSSTASFISRLATFKLTTYANKPAAIDAVAAAKCGWINEGKDRLMCGICTASWVVANTTGMSRDAANTLVEKQRGYLVEMHKAGCPWKSRQCDASIYHVPLQIPGTMIKELKRRAMKLHLVMKDVQIKHPLTTPQMQQFFSVMRAAKLHSNSKLPISVTASSLPDVESVYFVDDSSEQELSEAAMLTALFGWSIVLPSTDARILPSASRAASVALSLPATPAPPHPPLATPGRTTPTLSTPRPSSGRTMTSPGSQSGAAKVKADATLLFCPLCHRRVGLWAFLPNPNATEQPPLPSGPSLAGESQAQPRRQLDILKEHRSYCPYVVRSTVVPTLPVTPQSPPAPSRPSFTTSNSSLTQVNGVPGAVEGWRAVMTVVLRYGLAQRHRLGRSRPRKDLEMQSEDTEDVEMSDWVDAADEISQAEAMVEGVKTRGGRDLLKYVKGLLG